MKRDKEPVVKMSVWMPKSYWQRLHRLIGEGETKTLREGVLNGVKMYLLKYFQEWE